MGEKARGGMSVAAINASVLSLSVSLFFSLTQFLSLFLSTAVGRALLLTWPISAAEV